MRNVALTQKYIGTYYEETGDLQRAIEHHRRAYELDDKRFQRTPNDRVVQLDLAIDVSSIGNIQMRRAQYDQAIDAFKRSLEIRERLAGADPKDVHAQGRVAFLHTKLATLHVWNHRWPVAREHAKRAVTLTEPLATISTANRTDHLDALKTLADLEWHAGRQQEACAVYARAQGVLRAGDRVAPSDEKNKSGVDRAAADCLRR